MKKKALSLLLASCMIAGTLAGCGGGTSQQPAAEQGTDAPAAGTETAAPAADAGDDSAPAAEEAAPVDEANLTETQKIIREAEGMSMEDLAKKAIEESNGATFYGVGNSSRGKSALPLFIEYLQTIDPSYNMEFEWQQPKNNKIFEQLTADSLKEIGRAHV